MNSHALVRWSGLCLIAGAVILEIHQVSHPTGETAAFTKDALWMPSHLLGYLAFQLLAFGLIGLYARQAEASGALGLVAFVLTMIGLTVAAGGQLLVGATLQPLSAARMPELWDLSGPVFSDRFARLAFALVNLWVPGVLLMAIASYRARILPRWPAWLIGVSAALGIITVVWFGSSPAVAASAAPFVAADILEAALAVGLVAFGLALWRGMRDSPAIPVSHAFSRTD